MNISRQILYSPHYVSNYVLEKALENSFKFVDKVFIACGFTTWSYKEITPQKYDMDFLSKLSQKYNCELVFYNFENEEETRNHLLDYARSQEFDFMIIQDADEFLSEDSYQNLNLFLESPEAQDLYSIKLRSLTYWKRWTNLLVNRTNQPSVWYPTFAVNLSKHFSFSNLRNSADTTNYTLHEPVIHHGSYILTDEQMKKKITTWGHANDFNSDSWFNEKWLNWKIGITKDLHPTHPHIWADTILINKNNLPNLLVNWEYES